MAQTLRRLGRLGYFVAMAGVAWLVEACGGDSDASKPSASGGTGAPGTTHGSGGTSGGFTLPTATGGDTVGGSSASGGTGGEGGLHDIPCE